MSLELQASKDELREKFFALNDAYDVADLLEVRHEDLIYYLYRIPLKKRYKTFEIKKKSGGFRKISTPTSSLKIIQRKLNQVLHCVFHPKIPVHGFALERSIVTNARVHAGQRYVFNIDLKNFFPSIHLGRVRGMFMHIPYELPHAVATVLAQICCHDEQLPQGAPTSPIISNMLCSKMDSQLRRLAKEHRCIYTRYADDITFSTSMPKFPVAIATIDASMQVQVGHDLGEKIIGNGFEINLSKVRLQTRYQRQEVTGLTVNKFPNVKRSYVRQIRAMLHAWRSLGEVAAERDFWERDAKNKSRSEWKKEPSFRRVVKGKIEFLGMVRGKDNPIYLRFLGQLRALAPELVPKSALAARPRPRVFVKVEGKTCRKHLQAAIAGLERGGVSLDFEIVFGEDDVGDGDLLKFCEQPIEVPSELPVICIFDSDKRTTVNKVAKKGRNYKLWGDKLYSLAMPAPEHRQDTPEVCIEHYYKDEEIKRRDPSGRRLFLSNEFDPASARHKVDADISCTHVNKLQARNKLFIFDDGVFNSTRENLALSKNSFANNVLNGVEGFSDFDFSEFTKIFDVISRILEKHQDNK